MNKRSLCILIFIAFLLGCFFQYSRLDGFLHIESPKNLALTERVGRAAPPESEDLAREKFLLIYDPTDVASMYARHNMERIFTEKRKDYESIPFYEVRPLDGSCQGVALATGRLNAVAMLPAVLDYVRAGGTLLVLQKVEQMEDSPVPDDILRDLGIAAMGAVADFPGMNFCTNFLVGAKDFVIDEDAPFTTQANEVELTEDAALHIESANETPLL